MSAPQLRPLSVGEIIDVALKIWRRHFRTLARIVLVVVTPIQILSVLVLASVTPEGSQPLEGGEGAYLLGTLTSLALNTLAFLLSSAATLRAVSVAYLGGQPSWRESLQAAAARVGSLLWLFVVSTAALTLALLLFFVPFVWLGVSWSLAFVVLVAEGLGGTAALSRSYQLVRGRWRQTLGALALAVLIQAVLSVVVSIPFGAIGLNSEPGSVAELVTSALANVVSSVVAMSFFSTVLVLIYYDLRVRKEGFDLALMAQNVGVPGAGPAPWPAPGITPGPPWGPSSWPPPSGPPTGPTPGPPTVPPPGPPGSPPPGPPPGPFPGPPARPPAESS